LQSLFTDFDCRKGPDLRNFTQSNPHNAPHGLPVRSRWVLSGILRRLRSTVPQSHAWRRQFLQAKCLCDPRMRYQLPTGNLLHFCTGVRLL